MTAREEGFLLLTSYLGDPERRPLTLAQFRTLTLRARAMEKPLQDRALTPADLIAIGCDRKMAQRIHDLLSQDAQLQWYLGKGMTMGCRPITRISQGYPSVLHRALGLDTPGSLWLKGDVSILDTPVISLVGSRELEPLNREFAREVGKQAALQGYTLISGNARGADRTAQEACLAHGGKVISIVADALQEHESRDNVLYISEEGYDIDFSSHRALQRNRIIHAWGEKVFVAQCRLHKGGTWSGTAMNLRKSWRPVFCCDDASAAAQELVQLGAVAIGKEKLADISALQKTDMNLFDP